MPLASMTKSLPMPTTLITGGSSGIGLETARMLAARGHQLLLVALPEAELASAKNKLLEEAPGISVCTMAIDLSTPGSAQKVYDWASSFGTPIDYLINNAGFGTWGFINDLDIEREAAMIQLHVGTLYRLTRLFLGEMLGRNSGRIVNISSISAFQANPMMATYGATKSFVLQFSRAINQELRACKSQVRVIAVCPTPVKATDFQETAAMKNSPLFNSWMVTTPQVVAKGIVSSLKGRKDMVIPGRGFDWVYALTKRMPDRWQILLSGAHLKTQ